MTAREAATQADQLKKVSGHATLASKIARQAALKAESMQSTLSTTEKDHFVAEAKKAARVEEAASTAAEQARAEADVRLKRVYMVESQFALEVASQFGEIRNEDKAAEEAFAAYVKSAEMHIKALRAHAETSAEPLKTTLHAQATKLEQQLDARIEQNNETIVAIAKRAATF